MKILREKTKILPLKNDDFGATRLPVFLLEAVHGVNPRGDHLKLLTQKTTMNFAFKTRNCVSKNEEFCIQNDEFCNRSWPKLCDNPGGWAR